MQNLISLLLEQANLGFCCSQEKLSMLTFNCAFAWSAVVVCSTQDQGIAGSSLTETLYLCVVLVQSWLDLKNVDWDLKHHLKQICVISQVKPGEEKNRKNRYSSRCKYMYMYLENTCINP